METPALPSDAESSTDSLAKPGQLTSHVYNDENPPVHWSDTAFLIPHEWLRREMKAMLSSTQALPDVTTEQDAWKAELFATWILQVLVSVFKLHHTNEDNIYIPMLIEKGCKVQDKKISKDHEALIQLLEELQSLAEAIEQAKGMECTEEIASLKTKVPVFVQEMNDHLKEEELEMPEVMKANISKQDNDAAVQQIIQVAGLDGLQTEIPGVLEATHEWATDEHYEEFLSEIPPPILKLQRDILIPNYHSYFCAMRDAPTMDTKPALTQIPFDPSMLLPPPPPCEAAGGPPRAVDG